MLASFGLRAEVAFAVVDGERPESARSHAAGAALADLFRRQEVSGAAARVAKGR